MISSRHRCIAVLPAMACMVLSLFVAGEASAAEAGPQSGLDVRHDTSPPLRSMPPHPPHPGRSFPVRRRPNRTFEEIRLAPSDLRRQSQTTAPSAPSTATNWEGINNVNGVAPPDTNGDVGPNHYVQWVNLSLRIWSKTGTSLYGPVAGNTVWSGFGGVCESTNQGDPIVLYDRQADRWLLSQFAFDTDRRGAPVAPYYECVAVSTTGDPTGSYHRYAFEVNASSDYFPDYPKFGAWPDGYYMSTNNFNGDLFAGAGVYAFDRTKMLAGNPAGFVGFQLGSQYEGLLPSHLNGSTAPPSGAPNYFASVDTSCATGSCAGTGGTFQVWKFHADFATPASSSFTGPVNVGVSPYTFAFCNSVYSASCISQPGTSQKLDPLADRLMNRLQYRNFGDHESLVASHTVNVGSNQAGVRWYEVRAPGSAAPTVYQQGTFAPADGVSRWMGSAAMDGAGGIALGYSASSSASAVYPSIRYTGRLAGDPLGTMGLGETALVAGGGAQTGINRWGDYSSMSVDPTDDSTFWYTQEYYSASSSAGWRTRIGSFKLTGTPPAVVLSSPANGASANSSTPTFSGTAGTAAGDSSVTVNVYSGTSTAGTLVQTRTATVQAGGSWSVSASPALGDGTYTARAQQSGSGGTGYSSANTFLVDTAAPAAPSITSPANNSYNNTGSVTLAGTAEPNSTVTVYEGTTSKGTTTANGSGSWSKSLASIPDGSHSYSATATDAASNTSSRGAAVTVVVDTGAPGSSASSPQYSSSATFSVSYSAADNAGGSGLATVELWVKRPADSSYSKAATDSAPTSTGSFSYGAAAGDGTYSFYTVAVDRAGNRESAPASPDSTTQLDTAAPAAPSITSPANNSYNNTGSVTLAGTAEPNSTVTVYEGTTSKGTTTANGSGSWSKSLASIPDGSHSYSATATDAASNTSSRGAAVTVIVDTGAPAVTLTNPANAGSSSDPNVTFSGSAGSASGDSPTVTVKVYTGSAATGTPFQTLTATATNGTWSVAAAAQLASATYTARAQQSDAAGNTGYSSANTFTITGSADQPPVAGFTFSPSSPEVGQVVAFDGSTSSDPDGTIASYSWDFGDGGSGTGATPSHTYGAAGTPTVTLTVTDNSGSSASTAQVITVSARPPSTPTPTPPSSSITPPPSSGTLAAPTFTSPPTGAAPLAPPVASARVPKQRLRKVLADGLLAYVASNQAGKATVQLIVPGRAAKLLRLTSRAKAVTIGRASAAFTKPGTQRVLVKVGKAKSRLARLARLTLTLQVNVVNAAGKATRLKLTVILRR